MNFLQLRLLLLFVFPFSLFSYAAQPFIEFGKDTGFILATNEQVLPVLFDENEFKGVKRAITDLQSDFERVTDVFPDIVSEPTSNRMLIVGSIDNSKWIKELIERGKLDETLLKGKREKYIITTVQNPLHGVDEALVIAGSDMRGTIYGIYELSQQIGVSPWYWWADVPV